MASTETADAAQPAGSVTEESANDILRAMVEEIAGPSGPPVDCRILSTWMDRGACPAEALEEASTRWLTLTGRRRVLEITTLSPDGVLEGTVRDKRGRRAGKLAENVATMAIKWEAMDRNTRPGFPLTPLVKAWLEQQGSTFTPSQRATLILPKQAAQHEEMIPGYGPIVTPELPSFVEAHNLPAYLPGLEPEPVQIPTLLALYDRVTSLDHRIGFNNLHFRVFLMALITLPVENRNGRLQEAMLTIKQLVEDWLGWQPTWYRPNKKDTGGALKRALGLVRDMYISLPKRDGKRGPSGWQFPLMISELEGFGLNDRLTLVMRVPQGNAVGPQVDRELLKKLGLISGPAYRMYLHLCCEWDRHGARSGRLIKPTKPEVLRAPGGQLIDSEGTVLMNLDHTPVYTHNDRRAVRTGNREPNPARQRYPEKGRQDLLLMAYGPEYVARHINKTNRGVYTSRAIKALRHIENLQGCTIEELGEQHRTGMPWRIMPYDREALSQPTGRDSDLPGPDHHATR